MFKGMHPVFWLGIAFMYAFSMILMVSEMLIPGMTYGGQGVPAAFYYQTFGLLVLNLFLAWLWCYVPEQEEKKREMNQEVAKSGG